MARTYHVRFKAPRKRSHRQAKSGEAIKTLVLLLIAIPLIIAVLWASLTNSTASVNKTISSVTQQL